MIPSSQRNLGSKSALCPSLPLRVLREPKHNVLYNLSPIFITMISKCDPEDFDEIYHIINDAASAYKGVIPPDRWHEPYMSTEELQKQIDEGVQFWRYIEDDRILGVMGSQFKGDVTLIRHAYVRTESRNKGIGGKLLHHLISISLTPVLVGTWAAATWAIEFYVRHGFRILPGDEAANLLRKYWSISPRQVETSVVLANAEWNVD